MHGDRTEKLLQRPDVTAVANIAIVLIPLAFFVGRSIALKDWIVDDAAISFSYARNLASGHGLVSQPGALPVEGFSNPLWVLILSPFFLFGAFDAYVTPKILGMALVGLAFWQVSRCVAMLGASGAVTFVVLILLSLNASFVVWASSGLENALLAALVVAFLFVCLKYCSDQKHSFSRTMVAGLLCAGVALTRPEGISFVVVFPLILVLAILIRREALRAVWRSAILYGAVFTTVYGGYLIFRRTYFGDWYPNTYHVKGGPTLSELGNALILRGPYWSKWKELVVGFLGDSWWIAAWALLLVGLVVPFVAKRDRLKSLIPALLCVIGGLTYLLMTPDYMREFRFATPFIVLSYLSAGVAVSTLATTLFSSKFLKTAVLVALSALVIIQTWRIHDPRLKEYAKWPAVAFRRISSEYGTRYDHLAKRLGIDSASVLLPDIGGPLYLSQLRVYDLAGLCDRTIPRTRGIDQPAFYAYIFDSIRPTFIHTHGFFSYVSRFERDPRFARDYVGIADSLEWYGGDSVLLGDWVRRDQIEGQDSLVEVLRDSLVSGR